MNLTTYISTTKASIKNPHKVKTDILERWNSRVIPRHLHTQGRSGAKTYLHDYGKGISAPKIIHLALCAEFMAAPEMAMGFWEAAYEKETGRVETLISPPSTETPTPVAPLQASIIETHYQQKRETLHEFPSDLQAGNTVPMQPCDTNHERSYFIENPKYCGQAKRDGHKNLLYVTPHTLIHQSRSGNILPPIHEDFEVACCQAALDIGPFVLEGERYFLSAIGTEHRTAAQAATINIQQNLGHIQPVPVYAVFKALHARNQDLRPLDERTRVTAGEEIVSAIQKYLTPDRTPGAPRIECLPTAFTSEEKALLVAKQQKEQREGEIWTLIRAPYTAGKNHKFHSIRSKYASESHLIIKALIPSSDHSSPFGAIEVQDQHGNSLGRIGNGFDADEALKIHKAHNTKPGTVIIKVRHYGYTENQKIWQGTYLELM